MEIGIVYNFHVNQPFAGDMRPLSDSVGIASGSAAAAPAPLRLRDCDLFISGEKVGYILLGADGFAERERNVVGDDIEFIDAPEDMPEDFFKISFLAGPERKREMA
ncbi:hypothetical protein [Paratractidigestivibacter sp.]|uniref:hypothetical protein n=2 Tax=Paratractidigestivibacter sp. TaxID=2847316 RepID=UPI002AC8E8B3|nr:hypothetical protein [Paratractidigestivibacter sp.]